MAGRQSRRHGNDEQSSQSSSSVPDLDAIEIVIDKPRSRSGSSSPEAQSKSTAECLSSVPLVPALVLSSESKTPAIDISGSRSTTSSGSSDRRVPCTDGIVSGVYEGGFNSKGLKEGNGTLEYVQGKCRLTYKGRWVNDKKEGYGTLDWDDGRRYQGQFANDNFHGIGVMWWPTGIKYTGKYSNGQKDGKGQVQYPDGSMYRGSFCKGKMHGEIEYTKKDGTTFLQHYSMGKLVKREVINCGSSKDIDKNSECTTESGSDIFSVAGSICTYTSSSTGFTHSTEV